MPVDRERDTRSLKDMARSIIDNARTGILTSLPASVDEYDARKMRATVTVLITRFSDPTPLRLANVPVIWPQVSLFTMHAPMQKGDLVMLMFSHRSLSRLRRELAEGSVGPHRPDLMHSMNPGDCVALPGLLLGEWEWPEKSDPERELIITRRSDSMAIRITDHSIVLDVGGDQNVYLGSEDDAQQLVTREFLEAHYNSHIHSTSHGPSGPPVKAAPMRPGGDVTKLTESA